MAASLRRRLVVVVVALAAGGAVLTADTLVLRDGRRITGRLISVRNDMVEFEQAGRVSGRTIRYNRDEIRLIELDEGGYPGYEEDVPGARPRGMRERAVVVGADVPMVDTGIDVRAGQTVYFEATGTVQWGSGRRDGPEGEKNSPYNANRPIPGRPAAALIGTIGQPTAGSFFIGDDRGPIRMRASGRLYLGINDDYLRDNRGNFRVTVYY